MELISTQRMSYEAWLRTWNLTDEERDDDDRDMSGVFCREDEDDDEERRRGGGGRRRALLRGGNALQTHLSRGVHTALVATQSQVSDVQEESAREEDTESEEWK